MLQIWDEGGYQIMDTESSVVLILGSVLIGGDNQSQSGSLSDDRLTWGRPYFLVVSSEITGFIGYAPTITFNGNTLNWIWADTSNTNYPRTRFIYGLR